MNHLLILDDYGKTPVTFNGFGTVDELTFTGPHQFILNTCFIETEDASVYLTNLIFQQVFYVYIYILFCMSNT